MTQYPTDEERRAIQYRAIHGDESARNYLALLDVCRQVLEASDGISLARGMVGEHNDIYAQAVDDALGELMPVIYRISANGWASLKWYVPREQRRSQGTKNSRERMKSAEQNAQEAMRQAGFLKARQQQAENQEYLQQAMRQASESDDPTEEPRITLQYHQAMLKALMFLTPGTDCACQPERDALAEMARELDQERAAYAANSATTEQIQAFIQTCMTKLERVKNLCPVCHERLQFDMLVNFRAIHQAAQVDPNFGRSDWTYHPTEGEE